jgi:hypothetical protein
MKLTKDSNNTGTLFYPTNRHTIQSENIFQYGRQGSVHHQSNFPPVGVLAFQFNELQVILCFCSPYLKKTLENNSFFSQKPVTPNKHAVNCTSKYYNLSELTGCNYRKFFDIKCRLYIKVRNVTTVMKEVSMKLETHY